MSAIPIHMRTLLFSDYSLFFTSEIFQYFQTYSHMRSFKCFNRLYFALISFNIMGFICKMKVNSVIIFRKKSMLCIWTASYFACAFLIHHSPGRFSNTVISSTFPKSIHFCMSVSLSLISDEMLSTYKKKPL